METDSRTRVFVTDGRTVWERHPDRRQLSQLLLGEKAQEVFDRADIRGYPDNRDTILRYRCKDLRTNEDFIFDYSGQDIRSRHRLLSVFVEEKYGPGLTVIVG